MSAAPAGWPQALERDVRANAAYELLPRGALPVAYRRALVDAGVDLETVFALLVAPGCGLADKVVDASGAELFQSLRRPGRLPADAAGRLAELVLDGVLEVDGDDGFVSGPLAYEALVQPVAFQAPLDRLCRLSHAALDYAERLRLPVDRTTGRLYFYNRVPLSARWTRAFPRASAVLDLMSGPALARDWTGGIKGEERTTDWLSFTRRGDALQGHPGELPYKLYVSPAVEAVADVLAVLADTLTAAGARRFKVGPDAPGLLRADKIVVYMTDAEELDRIARALETALNGVQPHGVPFTAELAGDGLLSWGGDPLPGDGPVGGSVESWRVSVSRRLAEYLATAQAAPLRRVSPAQFALARLSVDGVDVRTFAPTGLDAPGHREPVGTNA